jgi:hypothetical protein
MAKLVAGLLIVVLAGATALALACDLRCKLQGSSRAASDGPCSSHDSHPSMAKHSLNTTAVVKAAATVPVLAARIEQFIHAPMFERLAERADFAVDTPSPGPIVLRI